MRLCLRAVVFAAAILWGAAILLVGLINLANPAYGVSFLQMTNSVYPWFPSTHTLRSVFIGTLDAMVDGAVAGLIFGWLYNTLTVGLSGGQPSSHLPTEG